MDYTIKSNRVILTNGNEKIRVFWFKDLRRVTISDGTLYFAMIWGKGSAAIHEADITAYNGWGVAPPIATIYTATQNAISAFENNTVITGNITAYTNVIRVVSDRDPLPTDDVSKGYTMLTQWLNESTNTLFQCSSNVTGVAVWDWIQYVNL